MGREVRWSRSATPARGPASHRSALLDLAMPGHNARRRALEMDLSEPWARRSPPDRSSRRATHAGDRREIDFDVAAGGVRIRAHLIREVRQPIGGLPVQARDLNFEPYRY